MVVVTHAWSHVVFTLLSCAVPLTPGLFEPPSSQAPFLQVDPAQLVVHSRVVQKVQSQKDHDEKAVNPHTDEGGVVTKATGTTKRWKLYLCSTKKVNSEWETGIVISLQVRMSLIFYSFKSTSTMKREVSANAVAVKCCNCFLLVFVIALAG